MEELSSKVDHSKWDVWPEEFRTKNCCYWKYNQDENGHFFSLRCAPDTGAQLFVSGLTLPVEMLETLKKYEIIPKSTFELHEDISFRSFFVDKKITVENLLRSKMGIGDASWELGEPDQTNYKAGRMRCDEAGSLALCHKDGKTAYVVPICFATEPNCPRGLCYTANSTIIYVINRQGVLKPTCLPMFESLLVPSESSLDTVLSALMKKISSAESSIKESIDRSVSTSLDEQKAAITDEFANRLLPLEKRLESNLLVDQSLARQTEEIGDKVSSVVKSTDALSEQVDGISNSVKRCLGDHDQLKELDNRVLSRISSSDSMSVEDMVKEVQVRLSSLRSYDDELRDLFATMSNSLDETYKNILAKASDVALKDVSLSSSVETLTEAFEKLGSLRSLAERSDSALDSLVTLLPTLKSIEDGIVQGAQSVNNSCLKLTEANGKVEACAEQALAATVSSNNTLSAIKDVSTKKDVALVTMTALTALASVVSSVATVQKAKGGRYAR